MTAVHELLIVEHQNEVYACFKVKTTPLSRYLLGGGICGIAGGMILMLFHGGGSESPGSTAFISFFFLLLLSYLTKVLIWNTYGEERITITPDYIEAEQYYKLLPTKKIKVFQEELSMEFNLTSFEDDQQYGTMWFIETGSLIKPPSFLYQGSVVVRREEINQLFEAIHKLYDRIGEYPDNPFLPSDN